MRTLTQTHARNGENVEEQTPALLAHRRHHMAYEQRAAIRCHLPFAIRHSPFTIYHLPFTIYHLPFTRPSGPAYLSSCTTTNKCV